MLIALFALAHLPIFRNPPSLPLQSSRCGKGKAVKQASTATTVATAAPTTTKANTNTDADLTALTSNSNLQTTTTTSTSSILIRTRLNMSSSNIEQDQTTEAKAGGGVIVAANGNQVDNKKIEVINFKPFAKQCCHNIKTNHTKIYGCGGTHVHGSSKVKLKNVVDYKWEHKYYYPGHLVAVHRDGKHLAYAINVNNKATGMEGMVRVCNTNTSQRALIKGMNGEVLDLQFAHSERDRILAVIDVSSMFVYKIDLIDGSLLCKLVLKVDDPIANYTPEFDMVSWCPYITSSHSSNAGGTVGASGEEEDENQLLLWSRSSQFQCFHVRMIVSEHGRGQIQPAALETGYLKIEEDSLITCAALSPDGTTVAAACDDGVVRFYQIYLFDVRNHRCLHEWKPHDGKRVSSLFFLDNINKPVDDAYWQYVITTSDYNTEIKLWNCSLWECLQTVNIVASIPTPVQPCKFIAGIDRSAGYLVISSIDSLAVYVMQINSGGALNSSLNDQASDSGDSENGNVSAGAGSGSVGNKETVARIQNVAEFKLSSGILSFSIVDASMRQLKTTNENYYQFEDDYDDDDDENNATTDALVVHMFVVQGKSLQECQIIYQPCAAEKIERSLTTSSNSNKRSLTPDDGTTTRLLHVGDIKQEPSSPLNSSSGSSAVPLDALFAKPKRNSGGTTTSSVVAVAVAAAAAPSAMLQDPSSANSANKSRSASPFSSLLNLMTPDAFSATSSNSTTAVLLATSNSSGGSNTTGTDAINTTAAVAAAAAATVNAEQSEINSHVLNTLRMLATVNAKGTDSSNANLLNLMNNTLIEDREQQKLKEKLEARKKFIAIDRNPERNVAENLASGGSSPSREVQEIMATQEDADADDYEPELENLESDEDNSYFMLCKAEKKKEEELANASPSLLQAVEESAANWLPDASSSKLQSAPTKKSAELQNAAQIMSQAVQHKNNGNVPPTLGGSNSSANSSSNNNTSSTLNSSNNSSHNATIENAAGNAEMNAKLEQLLDLVKAQSQQLNKLEHEVNKLQQQQQQQQQPGSSSSSGKAAALQPKTVNELAYKIEMQLCKLMEQYLKRYENEHKRRLAEFLHERENQNRVMRDSVLQVLNQYVMKHFTDIIGNVLNMELQRHILPCVSAKMDQLQNQMQLEMVQKLSVFDKTVKENIAQVCKSKQFLDAFGKSVLIGVQTSLQTAFIESMSSTLIPAYEKSSQSMFKQLHDAFSVGIKDFMVEFSAYLQHMPQPQGEELSNKLALLKQLVETNLLKHRNELTDAMLETQREVKSLEILLARQVQETIRTELRKYVDSQSMAMRSQAATPAPTYDLRDSIKQLLQAGQINKAFHQALLANDLNLVEFTLRHTDRMQVFAPDGCRLEQKVLLSLIQQISADMSNHNELKQSYLNEALLAINMSDPITREHAPKVLSELHRNCRMFIKNCPKSPQCSNVRLLIAMCSATYHDQFK
ncbi:enhancer of mRNA-decapping protein 4 homolog isoform X1 [Drosophila albomicans]|uniref:Enhancer of mRNA-decapping protein 4 homolog isoform X1 n=2 Tax=Drosophila albomicans TaxID=7291 RepID=A0A9C6SLA4_DROAB|nr:enhancer of mRNA-decapping protein 4 homolog isoform X1 [Drosophila albomicans]XP_051858130.1 enhancer of mRNA-decapping protein 4 homolog isoform X1 [Drosophila albomicans]